MGDRTTFTGVIGRYREDSTPAFTEAPRPPQGAPNLVVVVLDDVGFAQLGCFGSDISTPHLDALAARGLRYSNFHTTALCSPTRAAVLTGRNHHAVGMGRITDLATGFPGYDAFIPRSAGFLPEMVAPHGYATYAVGKWHLTPDEEAHLGAPRRTWPLGRGFERYYGFLHGETNQFAPALVHDNHRCAPPASWENGYHLTDDLVDHAVEFVADLRHVDPDRPFLLYVATGACHSPHQAPPEWIERYRGAFDGGWDAWREATFARQLEVGLLPPHTELSERPDWVPAWDDLGADERRLYARYMECFAGFLSHTDDQLGRLFGFLERTGDLDDTVVVVLSDNGASSEGGPTGSINDVRPWNMAERTVAEALERIDDIGGPWIHNNYPWGWTVAGNTPFRRWKREVHEGGTCDPLIIAWPNGIAARGEVRRQYCHAIDVLPTLLDVAGLAAPTVLDGVEQLPLAGVSLRATFDDDAAPEVRTTQYFEMFGCRAIYHEGWKAVTYVAMMGGTAASDDDAWELYDVVADPSECHDLAAAEPERLADMVERWWVEAERNGVLPVDSQPFFEALSRPPVTPPRSRYRYWPTSGPVEEPAAVDLRNRVHRIAVDVDVPDGGAEGVLVSMGSGHGGFVLFVRDDRLVYVHNFVALERAEVRSDVAVAPGRHELAMRYEKVGNAGGTATLEIDGTPCGSVDIPRFTPVRWSIGGDGLTVGRSMALPVSGDFRAPFAYGGTIHEVVVDVDGAPVVDVEARVEQAMRAQ
jgi:arylsulfatase